MELLLESKRKWLFSFLFFGGIDTFLLLFQHDINWLKTISLMIGIMLILMVMFFLIIILFKRIYWVRFLLFVSYTIIIIYAWIMNYINYWYVIIPVYFIMSLFMIWNLGGVRNCIIAAPYQRKIYELVFKINKDYKSYSSLVDEYNNANGFSFFSKVRKKREPNLNKYGIDLSGLSMFKMEYAIYGIKTDLWERDIIKLNEKIGNIEDKIRVMNNDKIISNERNRLENLGEKSKQIGYDNQEHKIIMEKLNMKKKKGIKLQKKVLKRRI